MMTKLFKKGAQKIVLK